MSGSDNAAGAARSQAPRNPKIFYGHGRKPMRASVKGQLMSALRVVCCRGHLSAESLQMAELMLFRFHNSETGQCDPSYETLASEAGCARSTAQLRVGDLQRLGAVSWSQQVYRGRTRGGSIEVRPSSNAYVFHSLHEISVARSLAARRVPRRRCRARAAIKAVSRDCSFQAPPRVVETIGVRPHDVSPEEWALHLRCMEAAKASGRVVLI